MHASLWARAIAQVVWYKGVVLNSNLWSSSKCWARGPMSVITAPLLGEGKWNQDSQKPVLGLENTAEVRKLIKVELQVRLCVTFTPAPCSHIHEHTHATYTKRDVFKGSSLVNRDKV